MSTVSFVLLLVLGAVYAYLAALVVPNEVKGGLISSAVFGIIGGGLIGHLRPDLIGLSLIVCLLVSVSLVFAASLMSRENSRRAKVLEELRTDLGIGSFGHFEK